jgi:LemA protein
MILLIVLLTIALVAFVYLIGIYNSLVALRERVKQAWSSLDALLQQRNDELQGLIDTCRQHLHFEQQTLELMMRARTAALQARDARNVLAVGIAEQQLRAAFGQLRAVAENNPQLRVSATFQQLQGRIANLEAAIADQGEIYNQQVQRNNARVDQFPDMLIARRYKFTARPLLELQAGAGLKLPA